MTESFSAYDREVTLKRHLDKKKSEQLNFSFKIGLSLENVVAIEELLRKGPNFTHSGRILLARTIAPSTTTKNSEGITFTQLLLTDPAGQLAIRLFLRNSAKITTQLEVGTVVALQNPCLNVTFEDKMAMVCEHCEGGVFSVVDKQDSFLKTIEWKHLDSTASSPPQPSATSASAKRNVEAAENLKEEGNQLFKNRQFKSALDKYSQAIKQDPSNAVYYSNRSATYALLEEPKKALEDAETGLAIDPNLPRLLFRKARALILLKQYDKCAEFLGDNRLKSIVSGEKELVECQKQVERFLAESKHGRYDLMAMVPEGENEFFLDHAEYFDEEMLEVKPAPGYHHGVIARRKIEAGTLVIASKALFYSPIQATPRSMPMLVAKRLNADPSVGRLFYKLYAGEELKTLQHYDESDPVQMERIENIVSRYCFNDNSNRGLGFWMMPAFVNFVCVDSNCDRYCIGDFVFIHTTRAVAAGEQLLMQLHPCGDLLESRDKMYQRFGNVCNCRLCLMESAESEAVRRKVALINQQINDTERLISADARLVMSGKGDNRCYLKRFAELLDEARALRPGKNDLNPLADKANFQLSSIYLSMGMSKDAIRIMEEVFDHRKKLGWVLNLMEVAQLIASAHLSQQNMVEAKRWVREMKAAGRLYFGDDRLMAVESVMSTRIVGSMKFLNYLLQLDDSAGKRGTTRRAGKHY